MRLSLPRNRQPCGLAVVNVTTRLRPTWFLSLLVGCLVLTATAANAADGPLTIAVIPKGTTHDFWKAAQAGAKEAERQLNAAGTPVRVLWKGPLREDDRTSQIDVVQNFIAKGVNGIVLAPLDDRALVAPVEAAAAAGIPTVIFDSPLASTTPVSYVGTDNAEGGRLAGQRLLATTKGQGKALMMRYLVGSASTMQREEGFLEALKGQQGLTLVSSDQHAGATRESALQTGQNLLNRWGASGLTAVYTPNESSTAGMALALQEAGLAGKVVHVGFDASEPLITALKEGRIDALVVQDPWNMGFLGVKTVVAHLQGTKVAPVIGTPVKLVTRDNLETPEIKALLQGGERTR